MASRKSRREATANTTNLKPGAKKQLVIMLISIILMIFTVTQVYYLTKYTLGYEVPAEKLRVYRWVSMLFGDSEPTTPEE